MYVSLSKSPDPWLTHIQHPHLSPAETWKSLFLPTPENLSAEEAAALESVKEQHSLFVPSVKPAPEQMLDLLRENEPDTITIVAVGPLTNLAIAAAKDPETFLRVKEVVVMGGAVDAPGNVSAQFLFLIIHSSSSLCGSYAAIVAATSPPHLLPLCPKHTHPTLQPHQTTRHHSTQTAKPSQPDDTRCRIQHVRGQHSKRTSLCANKSQPALDHATHFDRTQERATRPLPRQTVPATQTQALPPGHHGAPHAAQNPV